MGRADLLEVRRCAESPMPAANGDGCGFEPIEITAHPVRAGGVVRGGRLLFRPISDPDLALDLTEPLIQALAYQLWRRFQGDDMVNWLEAEILVRNLLVNPDRGARDRAATRGAENRMGHLPPQKPPRPRADPPGPAGRALPPFPIRPAPPIPRAPAA